MRLFDTRPGRLAEVCLTAKNPVADPLIHNHELTAIHIRNFENATDFSVAGRVMRILAIFASRFSVPGSFPPVTKILWKRRVFSAGRHPAGFLKAHIKCRTSAKTNPGKKTKDCIISPRTGKMRTKAVLLKESLSKSGTF